MKFLGLALCFFVQFWSASSSAQNSLAHINYLSNESSDGIFEKAESTSIKILGRGVKDRKTGASLTLACVGHTSNTTEPQCNELRWLMLIDGESYFVGKKLSASGNPDRVSQKALNQYLKGISKYAKKQSRNSLTALGVCGVGYVGGIIFFTSTTLLTGGMVAVIVGGWTIILTSINKLSSGINAFNGHPSLQAENADSWNWSINSKPINHNYFKGLFWQIANLTSAVEGGFPSFERSHIARSQFHTEENESTRLMEQLKLY